MKNSRATVQLLVLIGAIGIFQIATLRGGQDWGDDFAEYILQTVHMATGHGFVPYEFMPNPRVPGRNLHWAAVYSASDRGAGTRDRNRLQATLLTELRFRVL